MMLPDLEELLLTCCVEHKSGFCFTVDHLFFSDVVNLLQKTLMLAQETAEYRNNGCISNLIKYNT